ncbi:MAG: hypothetical protein QOD73_3259 [Solirubrobacteraceae bacterium]|jgi:hypothetical protein|nr:hypothetical protein [Solirubrobacteraceae bacterium]
MPLRQILPLAAVLSLLLPASALAAPTATVTGDDGNPAAMNLSEPISIRNMEVEADVNVPDATNYTSQVFDAGGVAASSLASCRDAHFSPSARNFADYHGNGTYTLLVRYFAASNDTCTGTARAQYLFKYTINAGTAVTGPPGRVLTRAPNSFVTNPYLLPVALNPGASTYEVRYALGGVTAPDGSISGPSAETFVDRTTGQAEFRFDKPGRWLIVARAQNGSFFTPWSAPVNVNAVAPFDLERVTFPDARGPSYKLRGQVRELAARGKVTISIARGKKKGKYHRLGKAKINSKGRFTKRFKLRKTGRYRIRYTYKGSDLVAAGRVTESVRIRRRVFFG